MDLEAYHEPVMAVAAGRVEKVGFDERSGVYVVLDHGQGITTSYAHLQYALVKIDQLINEGQPIKFQEIQARVESHTYIFPCA
ncbi:M23 family metallopeptidase [Cnuella takakiae]|uniref:M23 family metallopeptidase n=1 Tax=Cnuella takakiae TaxID=1302690 RepID=UPI00373FCCDA